MTKKRSTASLVVFTPERDLNFVSRWLGIQPTKTVTNENAKKGNGADARSSAENKFILNSPLSESQELSDHIEWLLAILESRVSELPLATDKITNTTLFCKFSSPDGQGSLELNAELLRRLAKHQLDIVIDLYPPEA